MRAVTWNTAKGVIMPVRIDRRHFLRLSSQMSLAAALTPLWADPAHAAMLASATPAGYKAIVVVTLAGGNDGNNTVIPLDDHQYASYAAIRGSNLALPRQSIQPLQSGYGQPLVGLHPALKNVAAMYNAGNALVVANVGPISKPATKSDVLAHSSLYPASALSHTDSLSLWETGQLGTSSQPGLTGWGGRTADYLAQQSGSLPPLFSTASSVFSAGNTVQAVAIQSGAAFAALPAGCNDYMAALALSEQGSSNLLVQNVARLRARAVADQILLTSAMSYAPPQTTFGASQISQGLKSVAEVVSGRSVTGANRQLFYLRHNGYDHHTLQLSQQNNQLRDLDQAIGSFFAALEESGAQNDVIVVTHSDFGRTLASNSNGGSDHAWGNHHFVLGGGIAGQRLVGAMPDMALGGDQDLSNLGTWIPTQSVVQMTAGLAAWLGLTNQQVAGVFPDLANFQAGPIKLF